MLATLLQRDDLSQDNSRALLRRRTMNGSRSSRKQQEVAERAHTNNADQFDGWGFDWKALRTVADLMDGRDILVRYTELGIIVC